MNISRFSFLIPSTLQRCFITFLSIVCVSFILSTEAVAPTQTWGDDQFMNLFTKALDQEVKMGAQYTDDGLQWFSKKLDKALIKDKELQKFFKKWYCDGCESVVSESLNEDMIKYINWAIPFTKNGAYDFSTIVKPHLDPRIAEVSNTDVRALNTLVNIMSDSILTQVHEQMIVSRDIGSMWLYYDGSTDNGDNPPSYDLMADIRDYEKEVFDAPPDLWPNINMYAQEVGNLINGTPATGQWWKGDISDMNTINSEKNQALGITSVSPVKSVASATATSCTSGTCGGGWIVNSHHTSFIKNNSMPPESSSQWKKTVQNIFEIWYNFMINYGINRSNPCITAPSINFFQSNFDPNAKLSKMFSQWVYPDQEVAELLKWFMNRESRTRESEDIQITDTIKRAFKQRWMDSDKPENSLIGGIQRDINRVSRESSDTNLPVSSAVDALDLWSQAYATYLQSQGKWLEWTFIDEHEKDSMGHIWVAFEELKSRAHSMNTLSQTLDTITEYLNSKEECQPS